MTSETVRKIDLTGPTEGWAALAAEAVASRHREPAVDSPSPLETFGAPEHDQELQRELDAREAVQAEQGKSPLDVLGGGG